MNIFILETSDRTWPPRRLPQPPFRRCYGPELVSATLLSWAERQGIAIRHIQPGRLLPGQQGAYVERYNRTVRHEWLGQYLFADIKDVQDTATEWLWTYNHERPNMALGRITSAQKLKLQMKTQTAA